ncbi:MAG TPA: hypothetical protein PKK26_07850 [Candidatus Wallbacteria bacterium]|nr:hypothetical protein [Candidatus Wallbacteria bacterium]
MSELTAEDKALFEKLANFVVKRKMVAPAILFLESTKPLNFIGSQFLVVMGPLVKIFFNVREYDQIVTLMEKRDNVESLICTIEKIAAETK